MKWKNRYDKIKVGDIVKCIPFDRPCKNDSSLGGWVLDLQFVVTKITLNNPRVLWGSLNGSGVYENHVEKVDTQVASVTR